MLRGKGDHERSGKGPGLAAEIGNGVHIKAHFFFDLSFYAFLQSLAGFHEAGQDAVELRGKAAGAVQEVFPGL